MNSGRPCNDTEIVGVSHSNPVLPSTVQVSEQDDVFCNPGSKQMEIKTDKQTKKNKAKVRNILFICYH